MKVSSDSYLISIKPLLKELLDGLLAKYEYASVLACSSKSKSYRISKNGTNISSDSLLDTRGFVVRVFHNSSYAEHSFNELTKELIPSILNEISSSLIPLEKKMPLSTGISTHGIPSDEEMSFVKSTEYEIHPEDMGNEAIIEKLANARKKALSISDKILDANMSMNYQCYHKLFLSKHKDLEQNILWTTCSSYTMASRGEEIKDCFKGYSNLGGAEILSKLEDDIENCVNTTIDLLDSEPIVPGEYDCICTPEVTGMIVHEAFGHGVEMDMFVKDRALAKKYINEYVASPLVTMHDGAIAADETATYFFDDEGMPATDTIVIDKGILKRGINDYLSAVTLGAKPTGNGRRESFKRKAYTRMTNTFFEPGKDKVEDMIASISYGFLLENATSGMEDPKNWGIQCMVSIAREIKDGKFTGKIFSPIVLTGYVPDLLKSISMVSDKTELGGGGFCGKGYKEWVKVSDGGPYIKARIRLG